MSRVPQQCWIPISHNLTQAVSNGYWEFPHPSIRPLTYGGADSTLSFPQLSSNHRMGCNASSNSINVSPVEQLDKESNVLKAIEEPVGEPATRTPSPQPEPPAVPESVSPVPSEAGSTESEEAIEGNTEVKNGASPRGLNTKVIVVKKSSEAQGRLLHGDAPVDLTPCMHCGRTFRDAALGKHQSICKSVFKTKPVESRRRKSKRTEVVDEDEEREIREQAEKNRKWKESREEFQKQVRASKKSQKTARRKKNDNSIGLVEDTNVEEPSNQFADVDNGMLCTDFL